MATARIEAAAVIDASMAKINECNETEDEAIRNKIEALANTPVVRGHLWWRREYRRTKEEAEIALNRPEYDGYPSTSYRALIERRFGRRRAAIARLFDLARAAIDVGDLFVTLDVDDVRLLGLEAAQ